MLLCCFLEKLSHLSCIRNDHSSVLSLMNKLGVLQHSLYRFAFPLAKGTDETLPTLSTSSPSPLVFIFPNSED